MMLWGCLGAIPSDAQPSDKDQSVQCPGQSCRAQDPALFASTGSLQWYGGT